MKVFENHPGQVVFYEGRKFPLKIKTTWTPDIYFTFASGVIRVIELKGYLRRDARIKMEEFKRAYPDIECCILFERDGYPQGCRIKCQEWADKHGIFCAFSEEGRIPIEWLNDKPL